MKGDCKGEHIVCNTLTISYFCIQSVGDFGLATSSLAAVEPADVSETTLVVNNLITQDMTLGMDITVHWILEQNSCFYRGWNNSLYRARGSRSE